MAVQHTMRVLVQDFSQLAPRPVRQPLGEGFLPAIQSGSTAERVSFTRGGWANPAGVQRSTLQRVRYRFENARLTREYWPVLDATLDPPPRSEVLLEHVKAVRLRYLDAGRNWQEQWPATGSLPGAALRELRNRPLAVEVTLELEDLGKLIRLVEVPG
jgi:general secretion pathway protein J